MYKLKTTSPALTKAQLRMAGVRSIDQNLDFGNGCSVSTYQGAIAAVQTSLEEYNNALLALTTAKKAMTTANQNLALMNECILISVASKYGKDSLEYKKSGGTPTSERKRPGPRSRKIAVTEPPGQG